MDVLGVLRSAKVRLAVGRAMRKPVFAWLGTVASRTMRFCVGRGGTDKSVCSGLPRGLGGRGRSGHATRLSYLAWLWIEIRLAVGQYGSDKKLPAHPHPHLPLHAQTVRRRRPFVIYTARCAAPLLEPPKKLDEQTCRSRTTSL